MNSYPDMLQVQGNVSDEGLDESLLQPEPFFSFIKRFIFNLGKTQNIRSSIFQTSVLSSATFSPNTSAHSGEHTCGEIPVSCFRWLLTRFDFLIIECMLSLEILSMNVSSSPFLYFTTVDSRGKT